MHSHRQFEPPSQPFQPSQQTQSTLTFPNIEDFLASPPSIDQLGSSETICGWLTNQKTLQTSLVIRHDKLHIIGRHITWYDENDLILDEKTVSSRHCKFIMNSAGLVLCEDLSSNGTFWNGSLIGKGESVVLSHGDTIWIRKNHRFVYHDLIAARPEHDDPEIKTVEKAYQILPRILGKGTFAKVHVAIHRKSKVQLAVKIMDRIRYGAPECSGGTNIDKEATILRTIDHANIVPVVDVIKTTRYIYIFMQMLTGGDLFDHVLKSGPMPELEAKFTTYQILQALRHLQEINISHRDIKPENLLLTSAAKYPRVLLTDFGMAREFCNESPMNTMCGTFAYMAPEVFDVKHAHGPGYGYSADCWSLGVTLYVILSGTHPFTSNYATEDEMTMRHKMRNSQIIFPSCFWEKVSPDAQNLIKKLLAIDPEQRWKVEDALNSTWIQKDVVWLQQRYRESVLAHCQRSSRQLGAVRKYLGMNSQVVPLKRTLSESDHSREYVNQSTKSSVGETTVKRVSMVSTLSMSSSTSRAFDISRAR